MWLKNLFTEFGYSFDTPSLLWMDNHVRIIILTHSLFIILTYAHLCILLVWTYSVLFVHYVMLLVT